MQAAASLLAAAVLAVVVAATASPAEPLPSLKHDTDVVRTARPNRRMFLVDVIRPPPSTADPLLTNEVDTSDNSDLPQVVRVLVPDPREPEPLAPLAEAQKEDDYAPRPAGEAGDLDASSEELTKLRPPVRDQQASAADWGAAPALSAPAPAEAVAAPSEALLPPPEGPADVSEWTKQAAQSRVDDNPAKEAVAEAAQEPSDKLEPPRQDLESTVQFWTQLVDALKMVMADEAASEAKEQVADVKEPVTDLAPPAMDSADFWSKPAAVAEARADVVEETKDNPVVADPSTELLPPPPGQPDSTEWRRSSPSDTVVDKVAAPALAPEPATYLLPPAIDSYMPEKASLGEARPDDFLGLHATIPVPAETDFVKDHSDSYLPEAGEIKALSEGPVVDDFLAIGEPPKEDPAASKEAEAAAKEAEAATKEAEAATKEADSAAKEAEEESPTKKSTRDSYMPEESKEEEDKDSAKDSYMPEESKEDAKATVRDSYMPEEESSTSSSQEDVDSIGLSPPAAGEAASDEKAVQVHVHSHEHDHAADQSGDDAVDVDDDDVDGDGVKMSESKDFRKKRHICKKCGGYGGFGGGAPSISVVINKGYGGGGGGGGYCDVCGQPVYRPQPQVVYKPVPVPVYKPVPVPVYHETPVCHTCNQPPPPCNTCGGGGYNPGYGGGSFSQSSSQASSQSSSYSTGWGK
ncbi:Dynein heavy chain-like protein [Frankliniella fusca]|uniref:Dynein heavy chain-like protein n=1 Tax=Frankliniella fusca TaxID=407009 RepID=A0AAE1LAA6_9NEOP|nr:Dynein heavy chain-like protein [Frankliniella fusca]